MTRVLGIDGDSLGWVGVVLEDGQFADACLATTLDEVHHMAGQVDAIAIDMPIGWVEGVRAADGLVREMLPGKSSSVFNAPIAAVRDAPTYADALEASRAATGRGLSKQSWALIPKIHEVTGFSRRCSSPVVEAHPELAFAAMGDGKPVSASKYSWDGVCERRRRLRASGIVIPDELGDAGRAGAPDVLDAGSVAWVAERVRSRSAVSYPSPPEPGIDNYPCAIWV